MLSLLVAVSLLSKLRAKRRRAARFWAAFFARALKRAIDGYNRFLRLVQDYADEILRLSRQEREETTNQEKSRAERGKGAIKKKNSMRSPCNSRASE
jgi:hypothetical protein